MSGMSVVDTRRMAENNIGASIDSGLLFSTFVFFGQD